MILLKDEISEKINDLQTMLNNYDASEIWKKAFKKMDIDENHYIIHFNGNEIESIEILDGYILYSWFLPKGVFTINTRNDKTIIFMYKNKTVKNLKQEGI